MLLGLLIERVRLKDGRTFERSDDNIRAIAAPLNCVEVVTKDDGQVSTTWIPFALVKEIVFKD